MSALAKGASRSVDMTQGSVVGHLIRFAVPLLLGNLFQQLYNTVDLWVVGKFVSNEAYSAVGTVTPIIIMLIGFFMGLASGAGVVISQYYGAKKYDQVRKTVHTSIVMTLVLGVVLSVVGILIIPIMLDLMNTDPQAIPEATTYLTIYFAGAMGLLLYNMGSGILRAVGDSRRPFYFLVVSALLNIALDLFFVIGLGMKVEGVAYATILSQGVSAALILVVLAQGEDCVRLQWKDLRVDWRILRQIIRIGVPSALQMAITSFSNVFVQSYINFFGLDCMSGWTTYSKLDQFIILPVQSLGLAATTFVGQNLGTDQVDRAKKGTRTPFSSRWGSRWSFPPPPSPWPPGWWPSSTTSPRWWPTVPYFCGICAPVTCLSASTRSTPAPSVGRASASRPPTSCWPPSWSSGRSTSTSWRITSPTPSCPSPWATPPGGWYAASLR